LRPMLLGAVRKAAGVTAPIEIPSKGRYQVHDTHHWAEHYGLTVRFPEPFPFRTLKTMRAAVVRLMEGDLETFVREAFALYWEEGGAPKGFEEADEDGPLRGSRRALGPIGGSIREGDGRRDKQKKPLRSVTGEAVERGVFGAPTFFVGNEMCWGNDRLLFVEEALERGNL
jgi:2-hydroxychromene-2-carboxylate isomerase